MGQELTVSIVVPTLNEVANVEPLAEAVMRSHAVLELVFVDDGSTDGTPAAIRHLADRYPVRLIERDSPSLGLSGAVLAGARAARGEVLVVMDADLSHPPEHISDLIRPLESGEAELVIGSRYIDGGATPGWSTWRRLLSRTASALAYPMTGVHDSMCGFFALRRETLLEFAPHGRGFKIAFEVLVHGGSNIRVVEQPIVFRDRARGVSKMSFGVALTFAVRWLASARIVSRRKIIAGTGVPAGSVPVGAAGAIDL